jgi:hypothetical protein
MKSVFLLGCYGCIFHGTGNLARLCHNFGIPGGGVNPPPGTPLLRTRSCSVMMFLVMMHYSWLVLPYSMVYRSFRYLRISFISATSDFAMACYRGGQGSVPGQCVWEVRDKSGTGTGFTRVLWSYSVNYLPTATLCSFIHLSPALYNLGNWQLR